MYNLVYYSFKKHHLNVKKENKYIEEMHFAFTVYFQLPRASARGWSLASESLLMCFVRLGIYLIMTVSQFK